MHVQHIDGKQMKAIQAGNVKTVKISNPCEVCSIGDDLVFVSEDKEQSTVITHVVKDAPALAKGIAMVSFILQKADHERSNVTT